MTEELPIRNSQAVAACCQTRDDAMQLLRLIEESGDTYFDRSDEGADVEVTQEHAKFFQAVINRMDIALAALQRDERSST